MSLTRQIFFDIATTSHLELDAEALDRVERRMNESAAHDRKLGVIVGVGIIFMIAGGWVVGSGVMWFTLWLGLARGICIAATASITPLVLIVAWYVVFVRLMRQRIRRTLRDCGYDVCGGCGYRLEGLPESSQCPECGTADQTPLGASRDQGG